MNTDAELLRQVQDLIDRHTNRTTGLDLRAVEVIREPDVVRVLIAHAEHAQIEDFVHVLAQVEAEMDIGDDAILILQPIAGEAA